MHDEERHPVDCLADEFTARLRAGQQPAIEDYAARYPEHAAMIRAVFPSIALVEKAHLQQDQQRQASPGHVSHAALSSAAPRRLGDFELVREIGRGGMGVVYEAVQKSLKRPVALKVISPLIAGSEKQLRRFRREAESAASLHHSNIVPVYGIGEDQGLQYYAMQLIDGVTLAEVVRCLNESGLPVATTDAHTRSSTPPADHGPATSAPTDASGRFSTTDAVQCLLGRARPSAAAAAKSTSTAVTDATGSADPLGDTCIDQPASIAPLPERPERPVATAPELEQTGLLQAALPVWRPAFRQQDTPCQTAALRLNPEWFRNVARVIANVADALQYAHQQQILHRDIKPGNLILDRDGTIWVADFGLARRADLEGVTQTGEIVGTLRYMAPEQLRGAADARTDLYALGVTLYELLTLQPAVNAPQLLSGQGQRGTIRRPRAVRPEIPADLETITLKACSPEPERRYQSAADLEADLRRFLEDRPIQARRVTPIERLWRWSRRNPLIATLSACTFLLLLTIASLMAVGNHEKQLALDAISRQYDRAEQLLLEKTAALESAEHERARAENNLNLAIQAFAEVFDNIAARGRTNLLFAELDEESEVTTSADTLLSNADVTLLETLLGFFDQLSRQNAKDLTTESAGARRRVGDIQQQLGRLDDAEASYRAALAGYQALTDRGARDASLILSQVAVSRELMTIAARRGDFLKALDICEDVRRQLDAAPEIKASREGRFALATTINGLLSQGLRPAADTRLRPRGGPGPGPRPGPPPGEEGPFPAALNLRLRREAEASQEALDLLSGLLAEDSASSAYRMAYAQAHRNAARIARMQRDVNRAEDALQQSIRVFEELVAEFPGADQFRYELAETLGSTMTSRPADLQRLHQALQLCRELTDSHADVPEYRALLGMTLTRIAAIQTAAGRRDRAAEHLQEAVRHHEQLADQFPDILMYQMALIRTVQQLAELQYQQGQTELAQNNLDRVVQRVDRLQLPGPRKLVLQQLVGRLRDLRGRVQ